jgi:beta-glucanase (GH16 family)
MNMMSKAIIISLVIGSLCAGGAIAAGIVLSHKHHENVYKDPSTFDPVIDAPVNNATDVNQINVDTGGTTVSNTTGLDIPTVIQNITYNGTVHVPVWWDEFSGDSLDRNSWLVITGSGKTGWGNRELQTYSKNNVEVSEGMMHVTALRDGNGDWTSGRVHSNGAWSPGMKLGNHTVSKIYFESLVVIPQSGNGLWPGFWFFAKDSIYGKYAASGEIDLMELRDGFERITQGVHYGGSEPDNLRNMTRTSANDSESFADMSFIFGCEWSLDTIIFTINGVETTRRVSKAIDHENGWFSEASNAKISSPFDEPFFAIFNIAVGGNFPEYVPDDTTPDAVTMSVDYFRVFADFE